MGKGKYLYGLLPIIFGIILVSAFLISNNQLAPSTEQGLNYDSMVCKQIIRADGTIEEAECSHNQLLNAGANITRDCLRTGTCSAITNITLCNSTAGCGTPSAAGTETFSFLTACGVGPDQAAGTAGIIAGIGNWTVTKTFTSTCDNIATNVTRIGNTTIPFAANSFTAVTLQNNDQLVVNWTMFVQ